MLLTQYLTIVGVYWLYGKLVKKAFQHKRYITSPPVKRAPASCPTRRHVHALFLNARRPTKPSQPHKTSCIGTSPPGLPSTNQTWFPGVGCNLITQYKHKTIVQKPEASILDEIQKIVLK